MTGGSYISSRTRCIVRKFEKGIRDFVVADLVEDLLRVGLDLRFTFNKSREFRYIDCVTSKPLYARRSGEKGP